MRNTTVGVLLAAGMLAGSNIAAAQAQQSGSKSAEQGRVLSAAPIHTESMTALQQAAQRLREAIQSLAQHPPGPQRETALRSAREALYDTQEAMIRLPADYRVAGMMISNVPLRQQNPAQNRTLDDSVKELRLASDRLRESIQAMADQPAGPRRNDAIKQAQEALLEAQHAMAWAWVTRQGSGRTDKGR